MTIGFRSGPLGRVRRAVQGLGLFLALFAATTAAAAPEAFPDADRMGQIRARGVVHCGLPANTPGFAVVHADGSAQGFEADLCRAVAATIFGSADRVRFTVLDYVHEFLAEPEIDLVFHQLTWKFTRELEWGLSFGPVVFHDGQTFLVRADDGIERPQDLAGRRICVEGIQPFWDALRGYLQSAGIEARIVAAADVDEAAATFFSGSCDAWSADASLLIVATGLQGGAQNYRILPERFSNEPLAPIVRDRDLQLLTVVRWTVHAMIAAEAWGLTSANVTERAVASDPAAVGWFNMPQSLQIGLTPNWVEDLIREVGNYGEVYERHFHAADRVRIDRGANRLWTEGGLLFAPPLF